jgi:hypothetical protein
MRRQALSLHRWCIAMPMLLAAAPGQAADWHFHLSAGIAETVDGSGSAAAFSVGIERDWQPFRGGRLSWDGSLFAIAGRRGTTGLDREVQALSVGLRWRSGGLLLGLSPALATARTDAVSGTLQFVTTLGWQWQCCALMLQHISNAGLNGRNMGENMLMLESRFGG